MFNLNWFLGASLAVVIGLGLPVHAHVQQERLADDSAKAAEQAQAFAGFEIQPYLTDLATTSAHLNWRLKLPQVSQISWGLTLDCADGRIQLKAQRQQEVELTGLLPGLTYHYRVDNAFQGSFRTQTDESPVSFAAIGHTHGTERLGHYPDALLVARLQELRPDFVVHCGDTTWFSTIKGFTKHFFRLFEPITRERPVYVSASNHDADWPFPDGEMDLKTFKQLFRYPYPAEIAQDDKLAHYAIEKNGTQLLFLCYLSPLGPDSLTRKWLTEKLASSDHNFNVVVFGGANPYYKQDEFFSFLHSIGVDAAILGDSQAKKSKDAWTENQGVPTFFTGTGGDNPHSILWTEVTQECLSFRALDASGKASAVTWIYSDREKPKVRELQLKQPGAKPKAKVLLYRTQFADAIDSSEVHGVQVKVNYDGERGLAYAYFTPPDWQGESGYRGQYLRIQPGDNLLTFEIPTQHPWTGESFSINEVRLVFTSINPKQLELLEAWIY